MVLKGLSDTIIHALDNKAGEAPAFAAVEQERKICSGKRNERSMIRKGKAMTEIGTCSEKTADLRRRAEEIAREKAARSPEDPEVLSPEETRQTLHDLRVHEIELMMQNEELRRAQAELDAQRARYFDLYDLAPVGYVTLSEQGLILEANLFTATLLGVARSDLVKRPITRFILKEDQDIYYLHRKQLFETGAPQVCESRLRRVDGSHFWVRIDAVEAQDVNGTPMCRLVMTDITERKQREDEDAMRASERRFRQTLENVQLIAIEIDTEGRVVFCNDFLLNLTGWPQEEIIGHDWFGRFLPENERESVRAVHQENLCTGISFTYYENKIQTRNGELRHIRWNNTAVRGADGRVTSIISLGEDISERKRAEEEKAKLEGQLAQAQKMEAIGKLAGGIAHDFNNLLMGILGYTSLMLMKTDKTHPFYEMLKIIERQVESGADLTRQLIGLAHGGKYDVKPVNANDLIIKTSEIFGRTKKEITIHRKLQEDLHPVEVDSGQIEQVLLNLYVNAWQAMPSGGELYLETQNAVLDEQYCRPFDVIPGPYVKIQVTDTGVGMDAETRQRIFEPFFTTKDMGRGTGLGLASSYGIIKNHGGIINVYSEKGCGSTFTFYLPASEKEILAETKPEQEIVSGHETILIVDDEANTIVLLKELLETLGYKTLTARNGREAIELYREYRKDIHMVILDMIMPGMNGRDTFLRLKEIDAEVKVLLASGYSIEGEAAKILELGCRGFIQKPFSIVELSQKIRTVLDSNQS